MPLKLDGSLDISVSSDVTGSLLTSGSFTLTNTGGTAMTIQDGHIILTEVLGTTYANDTAAAAGGIPVGGLYRTSGTVKIRLT